jgi:hypothetical protein
MGGPEKGRWVVALKRAFTGMRQSPHPNLLYPGMRQSPHPNLHGGKAGRCLAPNLQAANLHGGQAGRSPPNPPNRLGLEAVALELALEVVGCRPSSFSFASSSSGTVGQGSAHGNGQSDITPGLRRPNVPGRAPTTLYPSSRSLQGVVGPSPTPQLGVVGASPNPPPKTRALAAWSNSRMTRCTEINDVITV